MSCPAAKASCCLLIAFLNGENVQAHRKGLMLERRIERKRELIWSLRRLPAQSWQKGEVVRANDYSMAALISFHSVPELCLTCTVIFVFQPRDIPHAPATVAVLGNTPAPSTPAKTPPPMPANTPSPAPDAVPALPTADSCPLIVSAASPAVASARPERPVTGPLSHGQQEAKSTPAEVEAEDRHVLALQEDRLPAETEAQDKASEELHGAQVKAKVKAGKRLGLSKEQAEVQRLAFARVQAYLWAKLWAEVRAEEERAMQMRPDYPHLLFRGVNERRLPGNAVDRRKEERRVSQLRIRAKVRFVCISFILGFSHCSLFVLVILHSGSQISAAQSCRCR